MTKFENPSLSNTGHNCAATGGADCWCIFMGVREERAEVGLLGWGSNQEVSSFSKTNYKPKDEFVFDWRVSSKKSPYKLLHSFHWPNLTEQKFTQWVCPRRLTSDYNRLELSTFPLSHLSFTIWHQWTSQDNQLPHKILTEILINSERKLKQHGLSFPSD